MLCQFLLYRKVTQLRTHLFSFLINLLRFYLFYSSLPVRTQVQATGRSPLSGGSQDDTSGGGGWRLEQAVLRAPSERLPWGAARCRPAGWERNQEGRELMGDTHHAFTLTCKLKHPLVQIRDEQRK